ncbi:MAG: hypothetical protein IPO78_11020 [Saprospiraceae bacterium]|nr:hypothetical protein [Saprospiraceae bacterium]
MKTDWENVKELHRDTKYNSLIADYENRIVKARDKEFAHHQIKSEVNDEYYKLRQDDSLFQKNKRGIIFLNQDITHLMKMNNDYNYSTAFEFHTTSFSQEEKVQIIKQLAEIDAFESCLHNLKERGEIWKSIFNQDDVNPKYKEKLSKLQQIILLRDLGVLRMDIIKSLDTKKKAKLFAHLLNRSEQNIRELLTHNENFEPFIGPEILEKDEEIIKELIESIGLTKMTIKQI